MVRPGTLLLVAASTSLGACNAPPRGDPPASAPPAGAPGSGWASKLGQSVTVEGTARDAKQGALLDADPHAIWIDGLDGWPDDLHGKRVRVTGKVVERFDQPVFVQREGEPIMAGIPVPEGTDLHEASRRYLLTEATWTLAE